MYNNLIVWARTGQEGSQHAYFPKRGVITAWRDVFSKLSAPNIMEYDLKGFFDNVDLNINMMLLVNKLKVPLLEAQWMKRLNQSVPVLPVPIVSGGISPGSLEGEPDGSITLLPSGKLSVNYHDQPVVHEVTHGDGSVGLQVVFDEITMQRLSEISPPSKEFEETGTFEEVEEEISSYSNSPNCQHRPDVAICWQCERKIVGTRKVKKPIMRQKPLKIVSKSK